MARQTAKQADPWKGDYSDFVPSTLKPGNIAIIQGGDPNTPSGKAVYVCIAAGDVVRMATQDDVQQNQEGTAANAGTEEAMLEAADRMEAAVKETAMMKAEIENQLGAVKKLVGSVETAVKEVNTVRNLIDKQLKEADTASLKMVETIREETNKMKDQIGECLEAAKKYAGEAEAALKKADALRGRIEERVESSRKGICETDGQGVEQPAEHQDSTEMSENGRSVTDPGGGCYIFLSEEFKAAVKANRGYTVSIQGDGAEQSELTITEKTVSFFRVEGPGGLAFEWKVTTGAIG